ncbi:MAG: DNA cytosine methyltransferase [Saprospiraceae bacterium]|nr:DNA cytosine methyltransferase [Saprospiraceae bacterium]
MKALGDGKPTYIDLFAGCGGLSLGLHQSGWKGLFAIEKSPFAFSTLKYNLIDTLNHFDWPDWLEKTQHDIDQVLARKNKELKKLRGKVDLVAGGPPCQGFSTAGRREESDHRNELISSYIKFIRLVQPKIIFFENVKGFTQHPVIGLIPGYPCGRRLYFCHNMINVVNISSFPHLSSIPTYPTNPCHLLM